VICTGSRAVISPATTTNWKSYAWSGPGGFSSSASRLETGVGGVYTLQATDSRNCTALKEFSIVVSADALRADFLRISEAVPYSPIVFVDISVPVPDEVEWLLADKDMVVNRREAGMAEVVFSREGDFEVGIRARLGDCYSELYKTVRITAGESAGTAAEGQEQSRARQALQVGAYPNPAGGQLYVQVSAPVREAVTVSLVSALSGQVLVSETFSGQLDYLLGWDLDRVLPGTYYLVSKQLDKQDTKKIIVVR
jgi:hypothetical protein